MTRFKEKMRDKVDKKRKEIDDLLQEHGKTTVGNITISQIIGGMRDLKALITDTAHLEPYDGVRFRGYLIDELLEKLPKPKDSSIPYVEAQFYLLITGDIPTEKEVDEIIEILKERRKVPDYVYTVLNTLPLQTKPETMLSIAIESMQHESLFSKAYKENKLTKQNSWEYMLEDVLNLLPKIPIISAYIYRLKYKNNKQIAENPNLDFGGNFAHMMGIDKPYDEFSRLYFILLSDHENGGVSAHTTHLVASAWSDAYISLSAGINGAAGTLHGGATQESVEWFESLLQKTHNKIPTEKDVEQHCKATLKSGHVIPGYGHAVLRTPDPRFLTLYSFGKQYLPEDPLFQTVSIAYKTIPNILKQNKKIKNPWPNIDNIAGVIQSHYGIKKEFLSVCFSIAISIGALSNIVWDRALNYPIERPRSVTTKMLQTIVKNSKFTT